MKTLVNTLALVQRQTQLWKTFDFGHSAGYLKPFVFTFTFTVLILKCGSNYADMESAKVNKVTTYAVQNYIFTAECNKSSWKATRKLIKNCLEQVWVWTQLAGRLGFLEWGCSTFIPCLKKKSSLITVGFCIQCIVSVRVMFAEKKRQTAL